MLKPRAKKPQPVSRESHGITAGTNALRRALLEGLLVALIPALVVLLFLLLLRQPGLEQAMIQRITLAHAQERAAALTTAVGSLHQRTHAALSEALPTGANSASAVDFSAATGWLRSHFPEAAEARFLRLSDMGTAELDDSNHGLRNHIEVDLVRRALNGEATRPEAYRVNDSWQISIAYAAQQAATDGLRTVLLLSFPKTVFDAFLNSEDGLGHWALEQRYVGQRGANTTVFAGSVPAGGTPVRSGIANTEWTLLFTPSEALREQVAGGMRPPLLALLLMLLATAAGFALIAVRYARALRIDVERATAAAQHRTPLQLGIAELVPLARELRKLTLRRARMDQMGSVPRVVGAESSGEPAHAPAMTSAEGPASDMVEHIFRAYDIRGLADTELDDETVYRIGAAIGTLAGIDGEQTLVLGYDGRASSGRIKALVEKALLQSGRDVIDIGLVPTPLVYFATHRLDASSGVMITGSHNPAEYNGMKIVLKRQTVDSTLIDKIRRLAISGKFSSGTGHMIQRDVISDYLDEVVGDIAVAMPLRVVVDAGNGATAHIAPTLFEELGCEVVPLYCEVDGRFPNRSPDTGDEQNLGGLIAAVREEQADLGVAFDGDGDRIAVVTGSGAIVRADLLLMLFARDVVARNPGADVVYDVKCTRNLAQLITALGGRAVLWKTGHALMKQKMAETGAVLGGEFSGHMFFGERWYGFDDGMYAAGRLVEILSTQEHNLDTLVAQLPSAVSTPEILVPINEQQKFALMERFRAEARFPEGKVNDLDGVRVDFRHGWGLLRASNTSAALTARFEAVDEAGLASIMELFHEQLAAIAPELNITF